MVDSNKEDLNTGLIDDNSQFSATKPPKEIAGFEKRLSDRISKLMKVFVSDKRSGKKDDISTE